MDVEVIREKFVRSRDGLQRFGDDMKTIIFNLSQELNKSKDDLDSLLNEKLELDNKIKEQQSKIPSLEKQIADKKNELEEKKKQLASLTEKLTNDKMKVDETRKKHEEVKEKISTTKQETEKIKESIETERNNLSEANKEKAELEEKLAKKLKEKEAERDQLANEIKEIRRRNAVTSFLLEESAEDIPEVSILVAIMKHGEISKADLKDQIKVDIPPVLINRTLGRMAEKRLIDYDETVDKIRIVI